MPRIGLRQHVDHRDFRRLVDLGDEVVLPLGGDRQAVDVARRAIDDHAGAAGRLDRHGEHGMDLVHGNRSNARVREKRPGILTT
jgi:hypothetical protein